MQVAPERVDESRARLYSEPVILKTAHGRKERRREREKEKERQRKREKGLAASPDHAK